MHRCTHFTNFEKSWALANRLILVPLLFEVPGTNLPLVVQERQIGGTRRGNLHRRFRRPLKRTAVRTSLPARANAPAAAPLILPERDKVRAPNEPAHQACRLMPRFPSN